MFIHTKYSRYSNKELLSLLESKKGDSPIIDELMMRFSSLIDSKEKISSINTSVSMPCPICEGTVHLSTESMLVDDGKLVNYRLTANPVVPMEKVNG